MRTALRPLLLSAGLLVGLAGCESSTSPRLPSGSLSFTYTGAVSGAFSAEGRFNSALTGDFAAAFAYFDAAEGEGFIDLTGFIPRPNERADGVDFFFPAVAQPVTISLDREACIGEDDLLLPACGTGFLIFDAGRDATAADAFVPVSGTLQVTEVERTRMRGTFSGTAVRQADGATIQFTNGRFDVPVLSS